MSVPQISLSENGPSFSRIILGCWRLIKWNMDKTELKNYISESIDIGINTFDHADIYGNFQSEDKFGELLYNDPGLRKKIKLASKCGIMPLYRTDRKVQTKHYNTSGKHIISSVEQSLQNLKTDYLDLFMLHRYDPLMNLDEIASAFDYLHQSGKIIHFGVSNFLPHQFDMLQSRLSQKLVTNQVEFSCADFTAMYDGSFDKCYMNSIHPMGWSPFAGGNIFTEESEKLIRLRSALEKVGGEIGAVSIDQTALIWILKHPVKVLPILGTGKIERVKSAVKSLELKMNNEQWYEIWEASEGKNVP